MKVKRFLAMLQGRGIIELKKHEVVKCNLIKTVITPVTTSVMMPDITSVIAKVLKKQGVSPNDVSEAVITSVITNVTETVSNTIIDQLKNNNPEVSGFKESEKTATLSNSGLSEAKKSTPKNGEPLPTFEAQVFEFLQQTAKDYTVDGFKQLKPILTSLGRKITNKLSDPQQSYEISMTEKVAFFKKWFQKFLTSDRTTWDKINRPSIRHIEKNFGELLKKMSRNIGMSPKQKSAKENKIDPSETDYEALRKAANEGKSVWDV